MTDSRKAASGPRARLLAPALAAAALAVLAYLPALRGAFVSDDKMYLIDSPVYRAPGFWSAVLTRPFLMVPSYYRPLALASFMADIRLWGLHPLPLHVTNLLLHALNSALVVVLAGRIWGEAQRSAAGPAGATAPVLHHPATTRAWPVALAAAGFFYALHPALVEGVAWISSRFDLLVTTLLLLALVADSSIGRVSLRAFAVGLLFLLAALAKEMAVALVWVLPLFQLARRAGRRGGARADSDASPPALSRTDWPVYAALLVSGAVYLLLRAHALGALFGGIPPATQGGGEHLLLVLRSLAGYLRLVAFPFVSLSPTLHYTRRPLAFGDPATWVALAVTAAALAGIILLLRSRRPCGRAAGLLLLAAVLALLPVVNIVPFAKPITDRFVLGTVSERFLAFPLALLALALPPAAAGLLRSRWTAALPVLWLAGSLATIEATLPHWRDELSLWSWGVARAPQSSADRVNLSSAWLERGDFARALVESEAAIRLGSVDPAAWNNRGAALEQLGRLPEAEQSYRDAIRLRPNLAGIWVNLGMVLARQGKPDDAEAAFRQALSHDPDNGMAYANLGVLYSRSGRVREAVPMLEKAERLLPPGSPQQQTVRGVLDTARRRSAQGAR